MTTHQATRPEAWFEEEGHRSEARWQRTLKAPTKGRIGHDNSLRTMMDGNETVKVAEEAAVAQLLGEEEGAALAEEARDLAKAIKAEEMIGLIPQHLLKAATKEEVDVEADTAVEATTTAQETLAEVRIRTRSTSSEGRKNAHNLRVPLPNWILISSHRSLAHSEANQCARQPKELLGQRQAAASIK